MKRRDFLKLSTGFAAASAFSSRSYAESGLKEIRIGYQKNGVLVIARQRTTLEDHFKPLGIDVKWVEFSSGPPMMEAMNVGSVDYGAVGDSPPVFAQAAGADLLLHEVFLAMTALEVDVGGTLPGGEVFSVGDEVFGFALREGREVFALKAKGVVDEAVKVDFVGEREVSLEDQSIVAGKNGDEGRGELGEERVRRHGVLLQRGASATPF